jgi:hypothetical protein
MDHYRCHKVIKTSTSAVIVSDTVVFQHPTLSVPTLTPTDRIIHCLRALTIAVRADRTPDSCNAQLLAVESLRAIFNTSSPQSLPPNQCVHPVPPPRVSNQPVTAPTISTLFPRVIASPPRVAATPTPSTNMQPIAHRTRSNRENANGIAASAQATQWTTIPSHNNQQFTLLPPQTSPAPPITSNRFALLADTIDDDELSIPSEYHTRYHGRHKDPPSSDTTNTTIPIAIACPVLDHETGQTLEHGQLR